ncbi:MAG TPA: Wzz/FepE/Etk N-terminal domain-containing protein, partial [Longimicrobiales bacterium]|nr:Wzz/FepE/Etk N-terminal domain-containing protein [Longimicrobiales bacterium]
MTDADLRPYRAAIEGHSAIRGRVDAAYRVEPDPGWIDFGDILGTLRRNAWLIAIVAAIGLGAAAYLVSKQETRYTAMAIIRLIEQRVDAAQTVDDVPMGQIDPIVSELMVLTGRNVIGRAVDREGFRIYASETGAPATYIEDAEVTLDHRESGTIDLEFSEEGVSYGPPDDRRSVAYGEPIVMKGARFVVPSRPSSARNG